MNRKADVDRPQLQMKGFNIQAASMDNQLRPAQPPSFLDAAVRIGSGAVNSYGKWLYTPPTGTGIKSDSGGGTF
jgi:hypothetical protein